MSEFSVGDKVWTGVFVMGRWQRMASGIVTKDCNGYCEVDIMGLHGGKSWVTAHAYSHLEAFEEEKPSISLKFS